MKILKLGFFFFIFLLFLVPETAANTDVATAEPISPRIITVAETARTYYNIPLTEDEQDAISNICKYYNIDPLLIYQIMSVESGFDKNAISKSDDVGIMQINQRYFDYYVSMNTELYEIYNVTPTDRYNLLVNVITGCNAIKYWEKHSKTATIENILSCYNQGFNPTSTAYATKVLSTKVLKK